MHLIFRAALLSGICCAVAAARPVTVEQLSSFGTPDPVYTGFATDVAIDGDYALVTAGRVVHDPSGDPFLDEDFHTAFLFQRSGTSWNLLRRLNEYREDPTFEIPLAVAMQNGIAAVQAHRTDIWELTTAGWVQSPDELVTEAPGPWLSIDQGRFLSGDGGGSWSARVYEKDAGGVWQTAAVLLGKPRLEGSDDEFRGGPADISGPWAVVQQLNGEEDPVPESFIFQDPGTGFNPLPYGGMRPPAGATRFGPEVAIRWPDVFVAGGVEAGTYVFREIPAQGFQLATRIQALDSFMGSGPATGFAKSADLLLQHAWSHDRNAFVVNVFAQQEDDTYEHVAVLALKNGESLGHSISISGRRVLVGNNGNGLVHYFEIPANLVSPARIQDTFTVGNPASWWATSPGSQFFAGPRGNSRVYRQLNLDVVARAVRAGSDFRSQAIEADLRAINVSIGGGVGLATRFQGPDNFYDVILRTSGRIELRRMAGGTLRVLASAAYPFEPNRYFRVRLESVGTLHRVFVDGRLVLDADSSGPTHGHAALVTDRAQGEWDNVVISPTLHTTIYANNFSDGEAGPWTHSGVGFWNVSPTPPRVYSQSSIAGDARASIGVPTGDQIVRVRARLDTFANPTGVQDPWFGLMARHVDDSNFYYVTLRRSNRIELRKVVNGSVTILASRGFVVAPATWYRLRFDAIGNQLRVYVGANLLLEATDASHPSGNAGPAMYRTAADYDDFLAYQP